MLTRVSVIKVFVICVFPDTVLYISIYKYYPAFNTKLMS